MSLRVLLRFSHGLGDAIQAGVVLKHLRKYRKDWIVDLRVGRGKHSALEGLCHKVYHDQEDIPATKYDKEIDLGWFENYNKYTDRPNTKITNCLHEVFGLDYDATLGRYEVAINTGARYRAEAYLIGIGCKKKAARYNAVIFHTIGNTSPERKNLAEWQTKKLVELAIGCGRVPVVLDWDRRSSLPDNQRVFTPGVGPQDIWGGFGSGDASTIAALVSLAEAYVGVDSGPGKVASATETPTLICWTGHHPIQFHDPAPSTTHLIREDWRKQSPCDGQPGMQAYFEKHYLFTTYEGDHGLVERAKTWLAERLGCSDKLEGTVAPVFVLPGGIGDCMWALLKIKSIAAGKPIDIIVSGDPRKEVNNRAVPFLKRFPFIRDVSVQDVPIHPDKDNPTNSRGRYVYKGDGVEGCHHFLMPNAALEAGRRIEDWMPNHQLDWRVIDEFDWGHTDRGRALGLGLLPFVAFYLGPESGHTDEGHNRGWLWEPKHWIELGLAFKERGLNVAVVGASYDRSFWERYVRMGVQESGQNWIDLIGKTEIGETFAFLKESKCLISYQCGLGIVGHYLGINVAMWWRKDGDSCHPTRTVCFHDEMKDAWTRPGYEGRYMGMLYKDWSPGRIIEEIDQRGWLK